MSERQPHEAREIAESFGTNAERYDRSRPRYPQAMIDRIVETTPGRDFVDVGCGTGIAARQFQLVGCNVVGIDVDARMAEVARHFGLEVEVAKFEDWDANGRTFDAVVSGQTWHWINPVAGALKAAEVLRPSGRLAVFWNAAQPPKELADAFADVYRRIAPDSLAARGAAMSAAAGYTVLCERAAGGMNDVAVFEKPELWRFDWERSYTREEWLDQVQTTGDHNRFAPELLTKVLDGIGAAIDDAGGEFPVTYTALVSTATRR